MNIPQAIELLRAVEEGINEGETPVQSLKKLDKLSRDNTAFHQSVHMGPVCKNWAAKWYKDLHKNPAVYMYQLCGGYDAYLEYKYLLRRGNLAKFVPDMIHTREVEEFRTFPTNPNGEHEHNTPAMMKMYGHGEENE